MMVLGGEEACWAGVGVSIGADKFSIENRSYIHAEQSELLIEKSFLSVALELMQSMFEL